MTDDRGAAITDLHRLMQCVDELQVKLQATRAQYGKALVSLEDGNTVESALANAEAGRTRQSLTADLEVLERARHASRLSLIAAGVAEGMSINSISRAWGISRQLASRYVREVTADDPGAG
jgi:DNA invertase Pin-like site-specific DNA recombinase